MEQKGNLVPRLCLVWTTECAFIDKPRKSSTFVLMGSEWNLVMSMNCNMSTNCNSSMNVNYCVYSISLLQENTNKQLEKPFYVTTYLESSQSLTAFTSLLSKKKVSSTNEVIWNYNRDDVCRNVFDFKDYAEWNIVCMFHDVLPSCQMIKDKTRHLSTQTDIPKLELTSTGTDMDPLLTTEDKSVKETPEAAVDEEMSDFSCMLEREIFPDLKLRCGGRTFSGHKSILATRSQVFTALFQNLTKESDTVDVTDLGASILKLLMKSVYSGKVPDLSDSKAVGLYEAADKYAIHFIKKSCSDWMISNLTGDNCVNFLSVAYSYNDVVLKEAVISFINGHPGVFRSLIWQKFAEVHSKLAVEVYHSFFTSIPQKA